jgi:DNA-binding MarR family transcriptional regulator
VAQGLEDDSRRRPVTSAVAEVDQALNTIGRRLRQARFRERVALRVGGHLAADAYPLLRRVASQQPVRVSRLADGLGVGAPTVSRKLKELEAAGFVARGIETTDRRASTVTLTAAGAALLERVTAARRELIAEMVADWSDDDLAVLAPLMMRLADDVTAWAAGVGGR